jgi:glycosyltransferase involved in cell wall biosynthesis
LGGKRSYIRALLAAARELRASNPARPVIICGHINLLPAAVAARRITGGDLYLIVHGIDAWQPTRDPIANVCVRSVDDFLSVSAVTRRRFLQWCGLRQDLGVVLPNCVNTNIFRPAPKSKELLEKYELTGARVVMTLGRIASEERYKGFDEIIECLPEIGRAVPNLTYMIAGDGRDRLRLVAKAESLGLRVDDYVATQAHSPVAQGGNSSSTPRVIFVGRISEKEKPDYIRLADLFVMPSSGEGFGIVLLEAMACGIPVIGSTIDGSREALRDGRLGTLVDPRNLKNLTEAIIQKLSDLPDQLRVVAGVEYFSIDRFEKRVHSLINAMRRPGPEERDSDRNLQDITKGLAVGQELPSRHNKALIEDIR